MLLITEPFVPIVAAFGPTLGVDDYPAVAVPHPVSSLGDDDLRKLAASVIDAAEARLTPSG
jgi:hypothetical protein